MTNTHIAQCEKARKGRPPRVDCFFGVSHPAHYHMFKHVAVELRARGYGVLFLVRPKDVLVDLCRQDGVDFVSLGARPQGGGPWALARALGMRTLRICLWVFRHRPALLVGTDGALAWASRLCGVPAWACNEDDAEAVPRYARLFYPFFARIVAPDVCGVGPWEAKKAGYAGYQELGYLHPRRFTPLREVAACYVEMDRPYFLLRFVRLTAYHDVGKRGLSPALARRLVCGLQPYGRVYICSERPLGPDLVPYRLAVPPARLHHVLAFASLLVGDSQTLAAEAGVLGVPFVRFNDFVGRLSYLRDLETHYGLGSGCSPSDPEGFFRCVRQWVEDPHKQTRCAQRRQKMLAEKVDFTEFLTTQIDNYLQEKRKNVGNQV